MNINLNFFWLGAMAGLVAGCASPKFTETPYESPLISPGAKFGALPPAVQNAIRAEAGAAPLVDIVKTTNFTKVVYEVFFQNPKVYPPLFVAQDGSVLRPDLRVAVGASADSFAVSSAGPVRSVNLGDLPAPALAVIKQRAPSAEIDYVNKETWGDRVVYIVSFKDNKRYPNLYVQPDGTVLSEAPK